MALIGNHSINHRVPVDSKLKHLQFPAAITFTETDYSLKKNFGSDSWTINAGQVLSEMLKHIDIKHQGSDNHIILKDLRILSFRKGLFQWSAHEIESGINYELINNNTLVSAGMISGPGKGSGIEFGLMTFIPIIGNMNFDKGIEMALHRSLEMCLVKLLEEIHKNLIS